MNNIWAGARNLTVTVTRFFEIIIAIMSYLPVFIPWPHQGNLVISQQFLMEVLLLNAVNQL